MLFLRLARLLRRALRAGLTRRTCWGGFLGFPSAAIFCRDLRADQLFNRAQLVAIFTRTQRNRDASRARACGAANAVHISLRHFRQIKLDDMGHAIHINAACGDIGRHHDRRATITEGSQGGFARILGFIAMDRIGADAILIQLINNPIRPMLGSAENQRATNAFATQQFRQYAALILPIGVNDALRHFLGRGRHRRHRHAHRGFQHLIRQAVDFHRHGGAEKQRLAFRRHGADQATNGRQKALIEHLIRLIQYQRADMIQPRRTLFQMVLQTAGCGHQHINAAAQRLALTAKANTAENGRDGKAEMLAISAEAFGDLRRQFAGRA